MVMKSIVKMEAICFGVEVYVELCLVYSAIFNLFN